MAEVPNKFEDKILRRDEFAAHYEVVTDLPDISEGRQSRVSVLRFKIGGESEELVVWKRMGVGKHLTKREAQFLHSRLRTYRRSLRTSGWNIPKLFHTHVAKVDMEWQVLSYEQFIPGGDADHMFKKANIPNYRKWFLIRTALETLAEYDQHLIGPTTIEGQQVTLLPHGIDLKLANLVNDEGQVWFVDLFGPKELEDGEWVSYNSKLDHLSEERLKAVTATREGSVLRLFRLAEESWLESGSIQRETLQDNFEDVLEQSGIPEREATFIMDQIRSDYPWLDKLYSEELV